MSVSKAKSTDLTAPSSTVPANERRQLSNFLCFAVYSANLAFGRAYKPILDKLCLTYTQYITLVALSEGDDLTVGALGEKLFLESNTLTPILKKLETTGYLQRRRDPSDERQVRVSLLPAGRKLLDKIPAVSVVDATGLGEDFPEVQKSVTKLRDNLLRATQGRGGRASADDDRKSGT
ncbi:DNA-binding transcriptional regulator, MarR family [Phyllobacterium sp. YR620]|uniref:MarR family winged helix-turn-helix transcriptional regulator n=1 Tax=Phyllobacterium sp. YR620 TaxID=1881066 RepID=UPI00088CE2D3|nr:MarR family transcriptional regulator [Phyllobacterium sp. YR620]SDP89253.1 DNA-binding transcriptional regulator, MarR family [Phyllobacterium sp. YR620]